MSLHVGLRIQATTQPGCCESSCFATERSIFDELEAAIDPDAAKSFRMIQNRARRKNRSAWAPAPVVAERDIKPATRPSGTATRFRPGGFGGHTNIELTCLCRDPCSDRCQQRSGRSPGRLF